MFYKCALSDFSYLWPLAFQIFEISKTIRSKFFFTKSTNFHICNFPIIIINQITYRQHNSVDPDSFGKFPLLYSYIQCQFQPNLSPRRYKVKSLFHSTKDRGRRKNNYDNAVFYLSITLDKP